MFTVTVGLVAPLQGIYYKNPKVRCRERYRIKGEKSQKDWNLFIPNDEVCALPLSYKSALAVKKSKI